MSELRWLTAGDGPDSFPDPEHAMTEPNGLLAAGGSLAPDWLLSGYRRGIFPWFEAGQPILWWSPDPRAVLLPENLRLSRSLTRRLRRREFDVTADTDFDAVIAACAEPRRYTASTWITSQMREAYQRLHSMCRAHSFEAWQEGELAGGLYGVSIGRVFFGESMFARRTDASKVALAHAVAFLRHLGIELIDCQLPSAHLTRLGATAMPRREFVARLSELTAQGPPPTNWSESFRRFDCGD